MKLRKTLTDEADVIITRLRTAPSHELLFRALTFTQSVAHDAHLAYLDDKTARARALNRLADQVRFVALRAKLPPAA